MSVQPSDPTAEQPSDRDLRLRLDSQYRGSLMAYFTRRVRDRTEAEDLTQEVFLRVVRQNDSADPDRAGAYIFRIAANLLRDRYRRAETRQVAAHSSLDLNGDQSFAPGVPSNLIEDRAPERVLLARESLAEVMRVLDELGERTRDVFILYRLENMRQREIAALFGVSVSAIEKHIIKATAHLTRRLGSAS
ncbi:MAG: polymerase subunit sigma-24 [Rhodospirillales bacterium]|jgi:RNA polymerase sigma factor (sigma-70 family)|nr:polymerase subunit sigma-24 [Rhodospirillales bacterium]